MEEKQSLILQSVIDHLREIARPLPKEYAISGETEVYYDLGIYGDVLVFDLLFWMHREFGVALNIDPSEHAPREGPILRTLFGHFMHRRDIAQRPYVSLKVRDIMAAIEAGRWQPPVAADETSPPPQRSS